MTTITMEKHILKRLDALEDFAKEIRAALAAPATAPEKTVKEIMEFVRHYAANTFSSATLEDKIRRSLAVSATAPDRHAQELLQPPQQDTSLAATTKALTFARTALLVVNSGASQKAIALIDEAMNQAPIPNPVLKPVTDGEKIYALWHSSDANDLDDFLDGWRHAEAFHGITGGKT